MSMIIAHNMSAINTNRQLGVSTRGQSSAMEKLSSGYKINTGKDDPSGLVISEKLRAQEVGLQRAVQNTEEAMNVVGIAEGALNEMNNILKKMKTLAVHAASDGVTSPDQIAADQAEIDSAVQTIDRIARTTKFSDQTLLAGGKELSFDTNTLIQGTQNNKLLDANGTNFDQIFRRSNYAVSIGFTGTQNADKVTGIGDVDFAKQAMKAYLEVDTAKGTLSQIDENGKFTQAQSFILTGSKGSRSFNFDKGASVTEMVSMIHSSADTTGVDASLVFNSAQTIDKLQIGANQDPILSVKSSGLKNAAGKDIGFDLVGVLDNKIDTATKISFGFNGYDDKGNATYNIYFGDNTDGTTGKVVFENWDGKAGRLALGGDLKGLEIDIRDDLSLAETFSRAIDTSKTKLEDNTVLDSLFKADGVVAGGGITIDPTKIGAKLAAAMGFDGTIEFEATNSGTLTGTTLDNLTFNLVAKDKDGNIVAEAKGLKSATHNLAADKTVTLNTTLLAAATGTNKELFENLEIKFAKLDKDKNGTAVDNAALAHMAFDESTGSVTIAKLEASGTAANVNVATTNTVDFSKVNPKVNTGVVAETKIEPLSVNITGQTITGLASNSTNTANMDVKVNITGQLTEDAAKKFSSINDTSLKVVVNDTASGGTPTYTVMMGDKEISNNWAGSGAITVNGADAAYFDGLTFTTTMDSTATGINVIDSFKSAITITAGNASNTGTATTNNIYHSAGSNTDGGALTFKVDGIVDKDLKAILAKGGKVQIVSVTNNSGGTAIAHNGDGSPLGSGTVSYKFQVLDSTGSQVGGDIDIAVPGASVSNQGAVTDFTIGAGSILEGASFTISAINGSTVSLGDGATSAPGAQDAYAKTLNYSLTKAAATATSTGALKKSLFFKGGVDAVEGGVAFAPSIVGGIDTAGDNASRANGTIAVFGNTLATNGSGDVVRGVTNVGFEKTYDTTGNEQNAAANIQYGLNTDGQGRIYVKFLDNNSYELYKDASMSAESKVAYGLNGEACMAFNNSGLNGLIIDFTGGPDADAFNEKGVYISFAGIEGHNDGVSFDGDVIKANNIAEGTVDPNAKPKGSGAFEADRTLITGVELGTNTSDEGIIYTKSVYDDKTKTVQVFAYKDKEMTDANMVAKSEKYSTEVTGEEVKSMTVVLNEIRNDDDTAGTGLGIVLSFENSAFRGMDASATLEGKITFTNLGARIYSQEYGSDAIVKVNQTQGGIFTYYDTAGDNNSKKLLDAGAKGVTKEFKGQDATLSINGQKVTTSGLDLNVATQDLQARLKFNEGRAGTTTIAQVGYGEGSIFTKIGALNEGSVDANEDGISGLICNAGHVTTEKVENFQNGMQLQLGESSGDQDRSVISIQSMTMDSLGRVTKRGAWETGSSVVSERVFTAQDLLGGGRASLKTDSLLAMEIIEKSINDVTELRARLGAVQSNMLQTNSNNLAVTIENIQKTESGVRDTDMASTMTEFTKQQVLQNAGMTMLSQANSASQNILQILR